MKKHIDPGKPWQNGIAESFHSRFRDELLNVEVFASPSHAQVLVDAWRAFHNGIRPHSSLGIGRPTSSLHFTRRPRRRPRQYTHPKTGLCSASSIKLGHPKPPDLSLIQG